MNDAPPPSVSSTPRLFWASFIALVTTAFAFMLRIQLMGEWETQFDLDKTQAGTLFGAGFWPFGVSIVLFSLVIDKIGYGKAMLFAFVCHVTFAVVTIFAQGYHTLYWGSVIGGLAAGTVEAVINPLIATMYSKQKTKWLNILHAGWPGGLVVTGVVLLGMQGVDDWRWKIGLILVPTAVYGIMMLGSRFPVSERVAAGVSHRGMLAEVGWGGFFMVSLMIVMELLGPKPGQPFNALGFAPIESTWAQAAVAAVMAAAYGAYARSFGRPMFVFLLLVMLALATTELGVDSWITDLLGPAMGGNSSLVLIYTAAIMMVLRFSCGPIVEALKPLGVLAASAAIASLGIIAISYAGGAVEPSAIAIFVAATVYGLGKTFFWPTTLGLVAEQFPRGGAMTLNVMGGMGMLGVGVLGNVWLGNVQDKSVAEELQKRSPELHAQYVKEDVSLFGAYEALRPDAKETASEDELAVIGEAERDGKMTALRRVVLLPGLMLLAYIALILYFRARGGYKPVTIEEATEAETT